jgi:hypothetical protein
MLNLSKFFGRKKMKPRSVWDTLYDLYCDFEYKSVTSWWHRSGDEKNANIFFPEKKCNSIELKKIKKSLEPECENYFRFLEFYNGLTCGQWCFLDVDWDFFNYETTVRKGTTSNIKDKMFPIAFGDALHEYEATKDDTTVRVNSYYISTTGAIFSLLSLVSVRSKADLEQEPVLVSNSFEEFMNECVFGPRYLEFGEEDATYRFLQQFIREKDQEQAEFFEKFGKRFDENENPARDPRIMTKLRESRFIIPRQINEQIKDWPEGTRIHLEFDKNDPEQVRCIPIHDKDHQS